VGVACGEGVKERRLLGALAGIGRGNLSATPVDVSVPLVTAAAEAMASVPGVDASDAVAVDITMVHDLSPLLSPRRPGHRVVTLFGVISTLGPGALEPDASLMGPGDLLLVSANLLPDRPGAREAIMAQYDNPPTREWLATVLREIGVDEAGPIAFRWDEAPGGPAIVGEVVPARMCMAEVAGVTVGLPPGEPIRVLESFRHTADGLQAILAAMEMEVLDVAVSPSGEEGVAVARRAQPSARMSPGRRAPSVSSTARTRGTSCVRSSPVRPSEASTAKNGSAERTSSSKKSNACGSAWHTGHPSTRRRKVFRKTVTWCRTRVGPSSRLP
jgi:hypothetical protein